MDYWSNEPFTNLGSGWMETNEEKIFEGPEHIMFGRDYTGHPFKE